ncbi:MAG: porin [Lewinellaceae bacterium]|nr:porin [Lewinellaceae bacterium]
MKHLYRLLALSAFFIGLKLAAVAQESQKPREAQVSQNGPEKKQEDDSYKPLVLKLSEDGSKYVRFLLWHQHWVQTNNLADEGASLQLTNSIRRSRVMAYAQVSPRFLILTHFGLNNLTPGNITAFGNDGDSPQFFLHEAWAEYKITNNEALYLGAGLHYWRGLTRFASHGTTTFMTFDQPRPFVHWHSSGVTDQFNRHLGIYAKGKFKKFDYRLAVNNPGRNGLQGNYGDKDTGLSYSGFEHPDRSGNPTGNTILEGYFRYNFWDEESIFIPNATGTYLGSKRVLAVGTGFFAHPDGMYNNSNGAHENVFHYAVDAYLDLPLSEGDCLNAYAAVMKFDYGKDFVSRWAGTGMAFYGQVGYKLPGSRFMPYAALQSASYEGLNEDIQAVDFGLNYFISGHNAKLTMEYHSVFNDAREGGGDPVTGAPNDVRVIRLQAQVFL